METLFTFMHSMTSRVIRVIGGLWVVIYGADLSPGYAFFLAVVGTAIAVTGIADLCLTELVVNSLRARRSGPHRRAA